MTDLTRRASLSLMAGTAALTATGALAAPTAPQVFAHGVASGDPAQDSIVLWTRITTPRDASPVRWQLALDPEFREIVRSGTAQARQARDHTVKVVAAGLQPGRTYHYRFQALGQTSPTGRTRTLAAEGLDRLGLALMSCANYSLGYFTTYDAVAKDPQIDFLLHTGDYIYEYGNVFTQQSDAYVRPSEPAHETVSLADYRLRHATHKSDPQSQAMHAAHPLIALWDDHEVANDSWVGGAENHQPATEGDWKTRRDAAIQAYYEWMPLRDPPPGGDRLEAWRTYRFGDLATLITLETRLTARGQAIDYRDHKDRLKTPADRDAFVRDVLGDPARQMMSPHMKQALSKGLTASVQSRQPWRIIGNGVLMSRINMPGLRRNGIAPEDYPEIGFLDRYTDIVWKSELNLPDQPGTWDGYAGARQQFYAQCQAAGACDLLVLTGDSHSFWSNTLADDHGAPMGVELGTAGVSIPSEFAMARFRPELIARLDGLYARENPAVRWTDSAHRGYVRVVLTPTAVQADFIGVETHRPSDYAVTTLRTDHIGRQGDTLVFREPETRAASPNGRPSAPGDPA
jgi:alkaline phosphatase D